MTETSNGEGLGYGERGGKNAVGPNETFLGRNVSGTLSGSKQELGQPR